MKFIVSRLTSTINFLLFFFPTSAPDMPCQSSALVDLLRFHQLECHSKINKNYSLYHNYLCLRVRTGPPEFAGAAKCCNFRIKSMSQYNRQWHAFFCFIGCISKHKSLSIAHGYEEKCTVYYSNVHSPKIFAEKHYYYYWWYVCVVLVPMTCRLLLL